MAVEMVSFFVFSMIRDGQSGAHENSVAHGHEILRELYLWFPCAGCYSPALDGSIFRLCLVKPGWVVAFARDVSQLCEREYT